MLFECFFRLSSPECVVAVTIPMERRNRRTYADKHLSTLRYKALVRQVYSEKNPTKLQVGCFDLSICFVILEAHMAFHQCNMIRLAKAHWIHWIKILNTLVSLSSICGTFVLDFNSFVQRFGLQQLCAAGLAQSIQQIRGTKIELSSRFFRLLDIEKVCFQVAPSCLKTAM